VRELVRPVVVAVLSMLLIACGQAGSSAAPTGVPSPTASGTGTIDHATGATDILLRFDQAGGFVPVGFFASYVPIYTLYGDGTVIFRDPAADPLPEVSGVQPNRPLRTAHLTEEQIQATLRMAISEGGLGDARLDYPNDRVADASTATFILNAGGLSKKVSVYALGIEPPDSRDAPARAAFAKLANRLVDFDQGGTIPTSEYVPAGYRGYLLERAGGDPAKAWPWPDIEPADFVVPADPNTGRLRAKALTVAQAEALGITSYQGGFQGLALAFPADDSPYSFTLRPLLPDDDDAAAAPTPRPVPTPSAVPPAGVIYVPISSATLGDSGRRLDLTFVGSKVFAADDPCSLEYSATTRIVDGVLEIGVFALNRQNQQPVACDLIGYRRDLTVDLSAPFTGTSWRDLADPGSRPIPLS
jgi:hypothetical protein